MSPRVSSQLDKVEKVNVTLKEQTDFDHLRLSSVATPNFFYQKHKTKQKAESARDRVGQKVVERSQIVNRGWSVTSTCKIVLKSSDLPVERISLCLALGCKDRHKLDTRVM